MEVNRELRRGAVAIHRKYGYPLASKLAAHLISKGLAGSNDPEVHARVSSMCLNLDLDLNQPMRVVNSNLKRWHCAGGMFAVAFIMGAGPSAAPIGECLGVCYYLAMKPDATLTLTLTQNDRIDLFTENMREVVTMLSSLRLWSPLLKEIVNFIMSRFKTF
jgi:hypothetical protein